MSIHLKITRLLRKTCRESSTEGVWISNGAAFVNRTSLQTDMQSFVTTKSDLLATKQNKKTNKQTKKSFSPKFGIQDLSSQQQYVALHHLAPTVHHIKALTTHHSISHYTLIITKWVPGPHLSFVNGLCMWLCIIMLPR